MKNAITINNLSKKFGNSIIIENLNLNIESSKITSILGPSGCGKTTFLNILAELDFEYTGDIVRNKKKIGYVFQEDRLLPWLTVKDNIEIVLDEKNNESLKKIKEILKILEIDEYLDYYPKDLSGGIRQRVAIARAYYYDSEILFLDEPFKSLDIALKRDLLERLIKIWEFKKNTLILVTHDPYVATILSDKVVIFSKKPVRILDEINLNYKKICRLSDEEFQKKIIDDIHKKFKE